MNNLGIKLEEYWKEIRYRKTKENPNSTILPEDIKLVHFAATGIRFSFIQICVCICV